MRNLSKKGYFISNRIGRAIADFGLLEDGDKIVVAVSGGKDSLTMLKMLLERRRWAPVKYELMAAHITTDFRCAGCVHEDMLRSLFTEWGCPYRFIDIRITGGEEKNVSCFWCSWNRRKALFNLASELGFNKIALGHHKDDVIETTLLNLFYKGEISAINARQPLFEGKITIIRPLVYVEERAVRAFAKESGFPSQLCKCPNSAMSSRTLMKRLIGEIQKSCGSVKSNIFRAPSRIRSDYLCEKTRKPR